MEYEIRIGVSSNEESEDAELDAFARAFKVLGPEYWDGTRCLTYLGIGSPGEQHPLKREALAARITGR